MEHHHIKHCVFVIFLFFLILWKISIYKIKTFLIFGDGTETRFSFEWKIIFLFWRWVLKVILGMGFRISRWNLDLE